MYFGKPWSWWIERYEANHRDPRNRFCHAFGIPMLYGSFVLFALSLATTAFLTPAFILFVLGSILQVAGHLFEREAPEFFRDWRLMFVGARWWFRTFVARA